MIRIEKSINTSEIEIFSGSNVLDQLNKNNIREEWNYLYENSSLKTVFQSYDFIYTWYRFKYSEFSPLLLILRIDGELKGLLPLAVKSENRNSRLKSLKIVGAGEYDAEYQSWIGWEGYESEFLPKAFGLIFKKYPGSRIIFRFIPDSESLFWIRENKECQKNCIIQSYRRPKMEMFHPGFKPLLLKRHLKAKFNRLNRAGNLILEYIEDLERFKVVFAQIMIFFDFRQGALFNKAPFSSAPYKRELFMELFEKNLLHVTVLNVDGNIVSSIIGVKGGDWMHLAGLITHSPFYAKYSPGLVHIFLLGKLLKDQGFSHFDLTPGDDKYKERVSTNSDEVFELTIWGNPISKLTGRLRKLFHQILLSKGIRPMDFSLQKKKKSYMLKAKLKRWLWNIIPKRREKETTVPDFSIISEKNNLSHLLAFQEDGSCSRWEFLENAMNNINAGKSFYSCSIGKYLVACVWTKAENKILDQIKDPECLTSVLDLNTLYIHKEFKFLKNDFVQKTEQAYESNFIGLC